MRRAATALLVVAPLAFGGGPSAEPGQEHRHPSGAFTFRVPAGWTVREAERPGVVEASAGSLSVRFVWQKGDFGFDIAHVTCMLERPVPGLSGDPRVSYEHDFLSGAMGDRRVLDSAFTLRYDAPVRGHKAWRQRNLTVVGEGQTLCVVTFAPKSEARKARRQLDAIVASLTFPPAPVVAH